MTVYLDDAFNGGSEAGAWAAVLPFCANITVLPDALGEQPLDAMEGGEQPLPAFSHVPFHHDGGDTDV